MAAADLETRSLTIADAKAGIPLKAGHTVVLVIGDGKGTKPAEPSQPAQPAQEQPPPSQQKPSQPAQEQPPPSQQQSSQPAPQGTSPEPTPSGPQPSPTPQPPADPGISGQQGEADETRRSLAEATILGEDGKALSGAPWRITFADGSRQQGHTDSQGSLSAEGPPGTFTLVLTEYES